MRIENVTWLVRDKGYRDGFLLMCFILAYVNSFGMEKQVEIKCFKIKVMVEITL